MPQLTGPHLAGTDVKRALERIGIPNRDPFRWEALNWFVVFTRRDLAAATEAEWLLLNEEIQSLLHVIANQQLATPFSRDELYALQRKALRWLTLLVDEESTLMGPFHVHVYVRRGRPFAGSPRIRRYGGLMTLPTTNFAGHIPPDGVPGVEYHLASLLERWPDTVQRCLRCKLLFARYRGHALFCGRQCQSKEAAKTTRVNKKLKKLALALEEQEALAKTAKNKRQAKKTMKGARHGKKK